MKRIRNSELFSTFNVLNGFTQIKNTLFQWKILKNQQTLEADYKLLQKFLDPTEGFKEYLQKRQELIIEYFEQSKESNELIILKDENKKDEFQKKLIKLKKEYKEDIEKNKEQEKKFQSLLREYSEVNITTFSRMDLPLFNLTLIQLLSIIDLIEDLSKENDNKIEKEYNMIDIMNFESVLSFLSSSELNDILLDSFKKDMIENIRLFKQKKIELLEMEVVKDFQIFEDERLKLIQKYSEKNIMDEPIILQNQSYKILNPDQFQEEVKKLSEKNKTIIEEYEKLLNEKVILSINPIKFEDLPDNLDSDQVKVISLFME